MHAHSLLIMPDRPRIGLPGDESRICSIVGIFVALTMGQDPACDQCRKKLAKTLEFLRECRPVRRVGVDAVPQGVLVVVGRQVGAVVR